MKQPFFGRRFGAVTFVVAVITACANGDTSVDEDGGLDGAKKDSPSGKPDTGGNDTGSNMCTSCNIDSDCVNTCGTAPMGNTWCCDTSMNSCYPAPSCSGTDGGGTD